MPQRVQIHPITRRHPEGSVFVGDNSKWANPFKVVYEGDRWFVLDENGVDYDPWKNTEESAKAEVLRLFVDFMIPDFLSYTNFHALKGRDLACTCDLPAPGEPDLCHASALLRAANEDPS